MPQPVTKKTITIDPITRLEGHGKISIFLDDRGEVEHAYFQVPELRGFEKFVQGRPAEDMPQITSRICGVCPMAHHMASTKALDALYCVTPPPAARKIRELAYSIFFVEDHLLHFFFLGGPDFLVGPDQPKSARNILGVIDKVGRDAAANMIRLRKRLRDLTTDIAGKPIHPVFGLPGGVAKPLSPETRRIAVDVATDAIAFAEGLLLKSFEKEVVPRYQDLITSDNFTHSTYYMGMVADNDELNFYDGEMLITQPDGKDWNRFKGIGYLDFIAEHVEPWTYVKFCFLKPLGWQGFKDGAESSVYSVGPLARINVAKLISTSKATDAAMRFFEFFGRRPVHHTLAIHWARLIEILYAAERMKELASDLDICDPTVRTISRERTSEGVGIVEAPRGTLIHHYNMDEKGLITRANLIVATQNNAARIALSVDKAAKALIHNGVAPDAILNQIEMSFRAYDPCNGCATHSLPGTISPLMEILDAKGSAIRRFCRGMTGRIEEFGINRY